MRTVMALLAAAAALTAQPQRIVSTAPSITETLFALGLGDRVVGVSTYCHYPPQAATRQRIGTYLRPNVEAIVALRPDLVIVQSLPNSAAPQLTRMKLNVLEVDHGNLEYSLSSIQTIGNRSGAGDRASALVRDLRSRLDAIRQRTARLPRRSLVFIVGRTPGRVEALIAVGKGSYLNELIEIAGGVNALAGTPLPYPKITLEALLSMNPHVLVDMGDMADTVKVTEKHKRDVVALWERYPSLSAVSGKRVHAVASDIFVVPGPRIVEAAAAFERMLHPETAKWSARFQLRDVGMRYGGAEILRGVSLDLSPPKLTAIVGPNGAGKSTLLGILGGLREGYLGECLFDGREVKQWNRREFARRVSVVPQTVRIEFPFTAEQVVMMGRAPHSTGLFETDADHAAIRDAMDLTDSSAFRHRDFRSLSGGEQQRVILAAALAQTPDALLLDEPTTFLDLQHQIGLYRILRQLCGRGVLVIAVTHDLNLAASYCERVVILSRGEVVADASPAEAFQPDRMRAVFGVETAWLSAPGGRQWISYGE